MPGEEAVVVSTAAAPEGGRDREQPLQLAGPGCGNRRRGERVEKELGATEEGPEEATIVWGQRVELEPLFQRSPPAGLPDCLSGEQLGFSGSLCAGTGHPQREGRVEASQYLASVNNTFSSLSPRDLINESVAEGLPPGKKFLYCEPHKRVKEVLEEELYMKRDECHIKNPPAVTLEGIWSIKRNLPVGGLMPGMQSRNSLLPQAKYYSRHGGLRR
ncbi:uncharacterized protein C11orf97 homolog [Tupaia chinensis]|uniref:uncharacterized protein C11orf97 homolog n=1 Tax=Tupaia chinensis TaxID=246437 RepID=UPI0003C91999|nr:uncharacterized protein C11orf97 homolog [Tupaia chinensis]